MRVTSRMAPGLATVCTAIALGAVAFGQVPAPSPKSVALTFDDLPAVGTENVAAVRSITRDILDGLDRHHAPATGFVIGQHVEALANGSGPSILTEWTRRGYPLGNHTYTHIDFTDATVEAFEDDVLANEKVLAPVWANPGGGGKYFRFPYNHAGDTAAKHDAALAFLAGRGYQMATCTIDTSDYVFNQAYGLMQTRRDTASAAKLRTEYLAYTATEIDYYESLHVKVFGHSIPHVMLLHANRLNADLIEELLKIFETKGFRFVTLDEAQADAAYRTPDTFLSKFGPMWGYRWAKARQIPVNGAAETEPPAWIANYRKGGGS
jgi:peptidoglycan/xylan/chitin deacetylase (PgdA/CDA1 family)